MLMVAEEEGCKRAEDTSKQKKPEETRTVRYTEGYAAPELFRALHSSGELNTSLLDSPCWKKLDIWSFGCILYELCTGSELFATDFNFKKIIREKDKALLRAWMEPSNRQLHSVLTGVRSIAACQPRFANGSNLPDTNGAWQ